MSDGTQQDQVAEFWAKFVHDPVRFACTFWPAPDHHLTRYQANILESVADNTETWVHSAHGMGKSHVASIAAIWWFATRKSKILVISAGEGQLRSAMWGEIDKLLKSAKYNGQPFDFGFVKRDLKVLYPGDEDLPDPGYFLWLRPVAVGEQIHGIHVPMIVTPGRDEDIGTVLWIFEEGSSIPKEFFDVAAASRHRLLVVGNPVRDDGPFAEACKGGNKRHPVYPSRLFRKIIHISAEDSLNVKVGKRWHAAGKPLPAPKVGPNGEVLYIPGIVTYEEYLTRLETYTDYEKKVRLFGEFPNDEGQMMFPLSWLDTAQEIGKLLRARATERAINGRPKYPGRPFAMGIDVSQGGGDLTAWVIWGRFGVVHIEAKATPNTTEIAGRTIQLMHKWKIDPAWVAFDAGGGGKQIADSLRDKGYENILDVEFGGAAEDKKKYKNKRAELYGELREAMQPGMMAKQMLEAGPKRWRNRNLYCASLPPDCSELRDDLRLLPLLRDGEGRLRMLQKDNKNKQNRKGSGEKCLRDLLGRSPDRGDACALARFAWRVGREYAALEYIDGPLVY